MSECGLAVVFAALVLNPPPAAVDRRGLRVVSIRRQLGDVSRGHDRVEQRDRRRHSTRKAGVNILRLPPQPGRADLAFDKNGRFPAPGGQNIVHRRRIFLRTDPRATSGSPPRPTTSVFEFSADGKLLMTLGRKGVARRQMSRAMRFKKKRRRRLWIPNNGDIFIADGEEHQTTRVVKYSKDGKVRHLVGRQGTSRESSTSRTVSPSMPQGRLYVGDRRNKRVQ